MSTEHRRNPEAPIVHAAFPPSCFLHPHPIMQDLKEREEALRNAPEITFPTEAEVDDMARRDALQEDAYCEGRIHRPNLTNPHD